MSASRARVSFEFGNNFTGRMALLAETAHRIHVEQELARATWEPHDWGAFS